MLIARRSSGPALCAYVFAEMNSQQLHEDLASWASVPCGPFFDQTDPPRGLFEGVLAQDYREVIGEFGGREGFLGKQYLRLYRFQELISLNQAYDIPNYNVELFVFGSDGYGDAFAFCIGGNEIVRIPLIPIPTEKAEVVSRSFASFIHKLSISGPTPAMDESAVGQEVHLIQPLCFGGDFRDPKNIVRVAPRKHAELVRYWNKLYRELSGRPE